TTQLNGGAVTTSGAQTYNDAVTLGAATTTLTATTATFNGNLTLGTSAAAATATLDVNGDFAPNAGGTSTLTHAITGTGAGQFGQVVASGGVNLGGGTLALDCSSYSPVVGDAFDIVSSGTGITNPFNNVPPPGPDNVGGIDFNVTYNGGSGQDLVLTIG